MPSKNATTNWERRQEKNLIYVAYTRAKNKLGFIDENEFKYESQSSESLDNIEARINMIFKKSTKLPITKKIVSKIIKDAKRIDVSVLKGNALSIEDTKHKVSKFSDLFANKRGRR